MNDLVKEEIKENKTFLFNFETIFGLVLTDQNIIENKTMLSEIIFQIQEIFNFF